MRRSTETTVKAAAAGATTTKRMKRRSSRVSNLKYTLLLLILLSFTTYIALVDAQEAGVMTPPTTKTTLGASYTDAQLEAMSSSELERICLERGFEVIDVDDGNNSSANGSELTHDDYLDAARRCLGIEKELNELLDQYPDLAKEFEEEFQLMQQQQDELQEQIKTTAAAKTQINEKGTSTTDNCDDTGSSSPESLGSSVTEGENVDQQHKKDSSSDDRDEESAPVDLSVQSIIKEVIATFKNDIKKLIDILYVVFKPVLQPTMNIISKIKTLIRKQRERQQQQQQQQQQLQ